MKKALPIAFLVLTSFFSDAVGQENGKNQGASDNTVALSGYATFAEGRMFVLNDTKSKETSHWLKLGQTWHGYALTSFDPKAETLTVTKDETRFVLTLPSPSAGKPERLSFPGQWASVQVEGGQAGAIVKSMELNFTADGAYVVSAIMNDGRRETERGRYTINESERKLTIIKEKETGDQPFSLEAGILTLYFPAAQAYVKFTKVP